MGFGSMVVDATASWALFDTNNLASTHIQDAGSLSVTGSVSAGQGFAVTGLGTLTIAAASTLSAGGMIASALHDHGHLVAVGSLHLQGRAVGGGTVAITAGADLAVTGDCEVRSLQFLPGGNETLGLSQPGHFGSIIDGLVVSDTIDLVRVAATSASFVGGTLTLSGLSGAVASLHFAGTYSANAFAIASDGHGGTTIRLS